ncbi:MAG: hypothetical protein ILM98_11545 [Kiritimatiellae bacterium]|nr:hypothetical protein [Kiritimatiellia bacterium]
MRRARRSLLAHLAAIVFWLALLLSGALWLLDRSIPGFARHRLEEFLSSGPVAVTIDDASFNLFRGLTLEGVKAMPKRSLAPPLATAALVRISLDPSLSEPPITWLSHIHCRTLYVAPYPEWEAFIDALEVIPNDATSSHGKPSQNQTPKTPSHPLKVRFSADNASVLAVQARFLGFTFSLSNDDTVRLNNIRIVPDDLGYLESLTGHLTYDFSNCSLSTTLSGTLTPAVIRELTLSLDGETAVEYYDAITNIQTPFTATGEVKLSYPPNGPEVSDIRLTLSGNDFLYHGVPAQSVKFGLQWLTDSRNETDTGRRLIISPLDAVFAEGKYSGRLAWYPRSHATDFQAKATLPLKPLFTVIDMPLPDFATNIVFATPPRTEVSGRVFATSEYGPDHVSGRIAAARATAYRLPFDDFAASWFYDEKSATAGVTNFTATLAGGKVTATLNASTVEEEPFSLDLSAEGVRTDPLRRLFDPAAPQSDGHISLKASIAGNLATNTLSSLSGTAEAHARNAAITRIPLFAGLTDFIARNVAGIDLLVMQSDSDVTISVTNGLATVERFSIDGNMMSLVSKGKWRLDAEGMPVEGVAQVRFFHSRSLMGILARIVTLPVSKLMEFRVYGPFERPKWDYIGLIDRLAEATFWPRSDATEKKEAP